MWWILLACVAVPNVDTSIAESDPGIPVLPGDTSTDSGSTTGTTGDPHPFTAPGLVEITCRHTIPLSGKTDCSARFSWSDGEILWEGAAAVGRHGRSSSNFPKPQYAVELQDAAGLDAPVNLYDLGDDADWLLNGMFLDRALVRNRLAYDLFRSFGHWAPETAYVEFTVNGDYQGVFLLTERIEHGSERLDIADDDGTAASFIVKSDEGGAIASPNQYAGWTVIYPEGGESLVKPRLSAWESLVQGGDSALWDEMDQTSFLDFVILEEALRNNDGYYLSHHLYRDGATGKMGMIPWDLDLTLGQPDYNSNSLTAGWIAYRPDFVAKPAKTDGFSEALAARWKELRTGPLADAAVIQRIEDNRAFLGDALDRNWSTWDIRMVESQSGFPIYDVSTPEEEYQRVEAWIPERFAWVDENISAF